MPAPRHRLVVLLAALAVTASGCGTRESGNDSRSSDGGNELATADVADVLGARRTIDGACGSDGSLRARQPISASAIGAAVSTIASLTEQYPDRLYETGNVARTERMTDVADAVAAQLRRCGITPQADRLAEAAKPA